MSQKPPMDPKDQQNLLIAIALSLLVIFGWQAFVEGPRRAQEQAAREAALVAETSDPAAVTSAPESTPQDDMRTAPPRARALVLADDPRVPVSTPSLHGTISLRGGRIDDLTLARYRESVAPDAPEIVLLSPSGTESPYYAEFGWSGEAGVPVPDRNTLWQVAGSVLAPGKPLVLTWANGQGLTFERRIELDQDYMFTVTQSVRNDGANPVTLRPYGLVSRTADVATKATIDHLGPIGVFNNETAYDTYKDLAEKGVVKRTTTGGWFGFVDKYWLVALAPGDQSATVDVRTMQAKRVADNRFQTDFSTEARAVAPGDTYSLTTRLFAGAKEVRALDRYTKTMGIPHLDLAIDFGWLYFLTKPFFYALDLLAKLLGNYGYAILAFTVIVKLLLFPLAEKSGISMAKMKKLTPKMTELRETYANDQQRLSKEMIELYKREKVNPMSGCWPLLIQIPIFFALYRVLYVSIEMRHVPFSWVTDLAAADPSNLFTLFGLVSWTLPSFLHLGAWPLLMAITMALQMRMNPPPPDPTQKMIFAFMPWVLMLTMSKMPSGLLLYWTWSNILSMLQQYVIMRRMHVRAFD